VQQHPAGSSDVAASLTVVAEHPAAKASKRASVFMGVSIGAHHHHGARSVHGGALLGDRVL